MTHIRPASVSRRALLGGGGALVVGFASGIRPRPAVAAPDGHAAAAALAPDQLDSWIAVREDGGVVAFFGKMDPGQGVYVAIGQIVAEELDVPFDRVRVEMGDTATTVNQGGASGSTGIEKGGVTLRFAAAEARRVLVERAADHLGLPPDQLDVTDGVVSVHGDPARHVTYGELIGGRRFDVALQWNGAYGNDLLARGRATPKRPEDYRLVGTSVPRPDLAAKVFGRHAFVTGIRIDGMLHARVIRPPVVGAKPTAVDEASVAAFPGVRVVWREGMLAVLAPKEWDAIRASRALRVGWSDPPPAFPAQAALYDHLRTAAPVAQKVERKSGDIETALAGAARVVEAEYEWPFQAHASLGPACVVADVRPDGATVWTGTQKPHFARQGVAAITGLPVESVRAIWVPGAGCYGRNDAGDAAMDAAFLSQAVGAPVRVQYMRRDGTAWDPKGPASIHRARAGFDADGRLIGYSFESTGFSRTEVDSNESNPRDSLAGQLLGLGTNFKAAFGVPGEAYVVPNRRFAWRVVAPLQAVASPLRGSHLRDPLGPQLNFASESFIDELAASAGADPVEFRVAHLSAPRGVAVIRAAAERYGWTPRPAASSVGTGDVVTGRGIAFAQRSATLVAVIAEVEVTRSTGQVRARRFVVAHDCGLIINPDGTRRAIEGNIVHGLSRALWEEVAFDPHGVTSVDWETYPILDIADAPPAIDIVLIDRPHEIAAGAGEASTRPVAAAVANAIFDATGVRLRRAPFTPARVRSALV